MTGKKIIPFLLTALTFLSAAAQKEEILLNTSWKAKRSNEVPVDGTVISSPGYEFYGWMDAIVPGTILTTLLHNEKVPDPFFDMNNELIPDIYDTGAEFYTFWFQHHFSLPEVEPGDQVWLKFRGINYSANIFLNGERISKDTHKGMFLRKKYRITEEIRSGATNNLAVLVEPPSPVGKANGGQAGDGTIARSVTQQYTAGWDWVCPIRDRNTGIWDEVALEITGPVDLRHPFVKTRVPGKRVPGKTQDPAFLDISTELVNPTSSPQTGTLIAQIGGEEWTREVTIEAGQQITVQMDPIRVAQPQLWWPNGMGEPHLEQLDLRFEQNGTLSDKETVQFGIRENDSFFDEESGGRVFLINGQKIFLKGGNWISSDALLRLSPERYKAEVRMHAGMNMNMIRIWGGSITERPEFYEACDKYGILVWQDLWVTGDGNGRWFDPMKKESQARRRAYPDDHTLFLESVIDQVKMLRNHPSLYLWCGGNEYPPPEDIDTRLNEEIFPTYDGTRYYLDESTSGKLLRNTIGGNGDGPYGIQDPARFFNTPSYPFNPEIGSVGMPNVEAMRKMMKPEHLYPPRNDRPNRVWRYHKYIGYGDHIERFGEIKGIEDFCRKAQVVNYEQYRALQEGFNAGMWDAYTGMLVWKSQNPWTSLRGQFYDVFLDQTGGFYGYMHGAKPLHVQLNLNDTSVCIVNQTAFDARNLLVEARLYDLQGREINQQQWNLSVASNTCRNAGLLDKKKKPDGLFFVRLLLKDSDGKEVDENLYWLTSQKTDMQDLEKLPPASLELQITENPDGNKEIVMQNAGNETAFFTRLKVKNTTTGNLELPVFFEDNYITLFPGEQKTIKMDLSHLPSETKIHHLVVEAEAWNSPLVKKSL